MDFVFMGNLLWGVVGAGGLVLPVAVARLELVQLLLGFVLGDAVLLLDPSGQLLAAAGDDVELVVGELAPLLLGLALQLLPVAFDAIPVHMCSPSGLND